MTTRPRSELNWEDELTEPKPSELLASVEEGPAEVTTELIEGVPPIGPSTSKSEEEEPVVAEQLAVTGWEADPALEDHPF